MCSRYALTSPADVVGRLFACRLPQGPLGNYPPRYNIAPTQPVVIVRTGADHVRELALVRWGLLPAWVKDPTSFRPFLNARAELVGEKASFRGPMRHRRCIVPADCYYDWNGSKEARRAFMIRPRDPADRPLGLAGLWEHWLGAEGSELETMAVLTVAASPDLAGSSERMPAILAREDVENWLDVRNVRDHEAARLLRSQPTAALEAIEIGRQIGNPRAEGPHLQTPLQPTDR